MKTKIFSFLLVICAIMCACNNNIEEPEIFIEVVTDTVPKIILYNEDSVKLIKNGNPIIFEIKGFEISYFLKNNLHTAIPLKLDGQLKIYNLKPIQFMLHIGVLVPVGI